MRRAGAGALLLVSAGLAAIGGLWTLFKTIGTEWDICSGGDCTSGYAYAVPLLVLGLVGIVFGLRLLRSPGGRGAGRDRPPTGP